MPGDAVAPAASAPAAALEARLAAVMDDGRALWRRFDAEVRRTEFHPFVPANYEAVLRTLVELRAPGLRFLELGSATGVITILADLLGYDACGIEIDATLVDSARALAARHRSDARFAAGSFLPAGYWFDDGTGDGRIGTLGYGASGYAALGRTLADFDVVYGYPWDGEGPILHDLMRRHGRPGARLVLVSGGVVRIFGGGEAAG